MSTRRKPNPRLPSSDDDEDDTTPLAELKDVQAAKTAKVTAAAFKAKAAADKKAAAELKKTLAKRKREAKHAENCPLEIAAHRVRLARHSLPTKRSVVQRSAQRGAGGTSRPRGTVTYSVPSEPAVASRRGGAFRRPSRRPTKSSSVVRGSLAIVSLGEVVSRHSLGCVLLLPQ